MDPPYLHGTRKNYLYTYEMADVQHIEILKTAVKHRGRILISGYENQTYNEILKGWNKSSKRTLAEGGRERIETLWFNYELPQKQLTFNDIGGIV